MPRRFLAAFLIVVSSALVHVASPLAAEPTGESEQNASASPNHVRAFLTAVAQLGTSPDVDIPILSEFVGERVVPTLTAETLGGISPSYNAYVRNAGTTTVGRNLSYQYAVTSEGKYVAVFRIEPNGTVCIRRTDIEGLFAPVRYFGVASGVSRPTPPNDGRIAAIEYVTPHGAVDIFGFDATACMTNAAVFLNIFRKAQ